MSLTTYLEVLDLLVGSVQLDPAEVLVQPVHQGHVRHRVHSKSCLELLLFLLLWLSIFGQFIGVIMLALSGQEPERLAWNSSAEGSLPSPQACILPLFPH